TVRRKRTDADRWIDWCGSARNVHNLVRGLARPYVGALTRRGDEDVLVWRARLPKRPLEPNWLRDRPGTGMSPDGGVAVRTGDGYLVVLEADPAGTPA